jgi:hypothetical protein
MLVIATSIIIFSTTEHRELCSQDAQKVNKPSSAALFVVIVVPAMHRTIERRIERVKSRLWFDETDGGRTVGTATGR